MDSVSTSIMNAMWRMNNSSQSSLDQCIQVNITLVIPSLLRSMSENVQGKLSISFHPARHSTTMHIHQEDAIPFREKYTRMMLHQNMLLSAMMASPMWSISHRSSIDKYDRYLACRAALSECNLFVSLTWKLIPDIVACREQLLIE